MSAFMASFTDFMFDVGWAVFLGLGLIFFGMLGYALLCAADDDDDTEQEGKDVSRMGGTRGADRD